MGDAVANNNRLSYAQHWNSTLCFKIKTIKVLIFDVSALGNIKNAFGKF